MLKTVIIRFDFTGITNIKNFVDELKKYEFIKRSFKSFLPIERRNVTFSFSPNIIEKDLIPSPLQNTDTVYRFSECMLERNSQAILDIEEESICLSIDCRGEYHGSLSYTQFMASILDSLIEFDAYVSIKRIGIRKIDSQICNGLGHLAEYFDPEISLLHNIQSIGNFSKRIYTDIINIGHCTYNHTQRIDNLSNDLNKLQVIIDTDGYFIPENHPEFLREIDDFSEFLYKDMQDPMFIMFKNCVTPNYLAKHSTNDSN